jgi:hypothetical protein
MSNAGYILYQGRAALPPDVRKGYAFPQAKLFHSGYAQDLVALPQSSGMVFRKGIAFPHIGRQSREA